MPQYRLLIGNSGVGKSTLANCIAKTDLFKSGLKFRKGMTYLLDEKNHKGITYLETPGLADISMQKEAAMAITEGLKKDGVYQIFFVVTLEAGRIRPSDLATIKLILASAKDIKSCNIIINKVSDGVYDNLNADNAQNVKYLASKPFLQVESQTNLPNWLVLLNNKKLDDAENTFMKLGCLDNFVADAPCVTMNPNNVNDIPIDDKSFGKIVSSLSENLNQLPSYTDQLKKTEVRKKCGKNFFPSIIVILVS